MSAVSEAKSARGDSFRWLLVALLVAVAVYGNYYYSAEPLLYRVLGVLVALVLALVIALKTAKGQAFWGLVRGARVEARKVVWPTRQERNQTTLLVMVVVVVMALLLWGLDSLFGWVASLVMG